MPSPLLQNPSTPSSTQQRDTGRKLVLDTIRNHGEIARIDIARAIDASAATVTAIVAELLEAGLISEIAKENSGQRGRPRVKLCICNEAHKIAGIKVSRDFASVVITDFGGIEIAQYEHRLKFAKMSASQLCQEILCALDLACGKGNFARTEISAIGIGLAGQIDARRNFVHWSSSLNVRNVALGDLLYEEAKIPVFIDNDANLVARAEQMFGKGKNIDNFVVITIEHGVGMGIVIDHQLYRGARGCGAEFGHTKVQLEGSLCQCGQRGCLEAYVGDYALLREAVIRQDDNSPQTLDSLFQAAERGDDFAHAIFTRAGRMFAMGLANVINVFDPKLIILSGSRLSKNFLYTESVIDHVQRSVVQVDEPLPEILTHAWGDMMWEKGAAAYGIEGISALCISELNPNVD